MNPRQIILTLLAILEMNGVITYGEYYKIKADLETLLAKPLGDIEAMMPKRRKRKKKRGSPD